ncbi:MAG: hypothetical protein CMJ58_10325 [Planctomycetaceae bacterium]|nr:hypothetical protein [Planctomycetaceae bacterium]
MGRQLDSEDEKAFLDYLRSGRDEMNLLEHSISSANKNVDRTTRSIEFTQEARDPETRELVTRSWKVSFSAEYGRPVPKDDDVFVALMKVSQAQGLMDKAASVQAVNPQVSFSSRHLIKILGWGDDGRSYQAIDDALNRLCGVRIVATNYWYDNANKLWVDRKFGIIDDVFLYERAKYDRAKRRAVAAGEPHPQSWIRWSDVMLESFQAGYVRKLDIEFYRSLTNPISRKLFRYLGKQFWERSSRTRHEIDLADLCVEKLGYKRGTPIPELERRVAPAIEELERSGVFGLQHRLEKGYGRCRVVFRCNRQSRTKRETAPALGLAQKLVELGIRPADAETAVRRHSPERILEDVEDSAFRERAGMLKKSRAGFLATMLKSDKPFDRPLGFVSSMEKKRLAESAAASRTAKQKVATAKRMEQTARAQKESREFERFLTSLGGDAAVQAFAERAFQVVRPFYRTQCQQRLAAGQTDAAETYRRMAMEQLWKRTAKKSNHSTSNTGS